MPKALTECTYINLSEHFKASAIKYNKTDLIARGGIVPFYLHPLSNNHFEIRFCMVSDAWRKRNDGMPYDDPFIPFGIPKGTKKMAVKTSVGPVWMDVKALGNRVKRDQVLAMETHMGTALAEAKEETDLRPENIQTLYECGLFEYKKDDPTYVYAAHVKSPDSLHATPYTSHLEWLSLQDIKTGAQANICKMHAAKLISVIHEGIVRYFAQTHPEIRFSCASPRNWTEQYQKLIAEKKRLGLQK